MGLWKLLFNRKGEPQNKKARGAFYCFHTEFLPPGRHNAVERVIELFCPNQQDSSIKYGGYFFFEGDVTCDADTWRSAVRELSISHLQPAFTYMVAVTGTGPFSFEDVGQQLKPLPGYLGTVLFREKDPDTDFRRFYRLADGLGLCKVFNIHLGTTFIRNGYSIIEDRALRALGFNEIQE
jgi:hypothetical protein